jgi:hypothetical protein
MRLHRDCEARAVERALSRPRTDASPLVQACCAALHLFAESREAVAPNARPFIAKAQRRRCSARRRTRAALHRGHRGLDRRRHRRRHRAARRTGARTSSRLGVAQARPVPLLQHRATGPACCGSRWPPCLHAADVPYLHGMVGLRLRAVPPACARPRPARAVPSRCAARNRGRTTRWRHVMLTEGRLAEGPGRSCAGVSDTWTGLNSFMVTHNWWHVALFLIDLGRDAEALAVYDQRRLGRGEGLHAGPDRRRVAVRAAGARGHRRRRALAGRGAATWCSAGPTMCCPFSTCSTSTAWRARAGPEADVLLQQHRGLRADAPPVDARRVGARLRAGRTRAAGPCARRHGRAPSRAWAWRCRASSRSAAATRSAICSSSCTSTRWYARGTEAHAHGCAQGMLQQQLNGQPESLRLRRQTAAVYSKLGLDALLQG